MKKYSEPKIMVTKADQERLLAIASAAPESFADAAERLLVEMERAKVVTKAPADLVQMGSAVEYSSDDGATRRVTLVYPGKPTSPPARSRCSRPSAPP